MAEETKKKVVAKKAAKKVTKKATKKVAKKVAKKATKKIAKKVSKKITKKTSKKTAKKTPRKTSTASQSSFSNAADKIQQQFTKLNSDKAEEMARQIWLAGLGVYGRAFEELQEVYEKTNHNREDFFSNLVDRGELIHNDVENLVSQSKESFENRLSSIKDRVEDAVSTSKDRFGDAKDRMEDVYTSSPFSKRLTQIADKLDELSSKLEKKK